MIDICNEIPDFPIPRKKLLYTIRSEAKDNISVSKSYNRPRGPTID